MDTKKLRQRILDLAIRGKLVPQDPTDEPATVLLDRIRSEKERLIAEGKIKRPKAQKNASDTPHYHDFTPPFAIPSTWEWVTIKEICSKIGSGSTPKGSNYSVDGIPFFRSQNVYNEGLVYNDIKYISEEIHTSMIGTEVIAKDLLLNITGGSLGRCAVVPNDFVKGNVSQHVCILRPVLVIPEYVHCLILSSDFAKSMNLTGSGREGLPKYNLEIMNFPLPPLSEQKRIVSAVNVFIKYLNAIDFEKLHLEDLMSSAKSKILELAITGKLVPQNPDDEPAAELLKRINPDAKIVTDNRQCQKLPDSWVICQLGDIFNHNTGKALNSSNQEGELLEYITTSNVYWTHFEIDELKLMRYKLSEIEKCQVTKGDLLVCEGGDIGRSAIWNYDWDVMIQNHIHRLRSIQNCASHRLYYYILMLYKSKDMIGGKGIGLMGLSSKALHQLIVPFPPREEQYRIVAKIEELFSALDIIKEALQA